MEHERRLRPVHILLVEDNPADVALLKEALRDSTADWRLTVAGDGDEALDLLRGSNGHPAICPDLILLDLNLPKRDGRSVLQAIKQDPKLLMIPVIVLSTSGARRDIQGAYACHANCYVQKPATLPDYLATIGDLEQFWLSTAKLPTD